MLCALCKFATTDYGSSSMMCSPCEQRLHTQLHLLRPIMRRAVVVIATLRHVVSAVERVTPEDVVLIDLSATLTAIEEELEHEVDRWSEFVIRVDARATTP